MKNFLSNTIFVFKVVFDLLLEIPKSILRIIRSYWIKGIIFYQNKQFQRAQTIERLNEILYKIIKNKKYIPSRWSDRAKHYNRPQDLFILYDNNYKKIMNESYNPQNTYFHNIHLSRFLTFIEKLSIQDMKNYGIEWNLLQYARSANIEEFKFCVEFLAPRFPKAPYSLYEGLLEFNQCYLDNSLKPQKISLLLNHYHFDMSQTPEEIVGDDSYDYLQLYWGCETPKPRLLLILLYQPLNAVDKEILKSYQEYQRLVLPQVLEFWSAAEIQKFIDNLNSKHGTVEGLDSQTLNSLIDMKKSLEEKKRLDLILPVALGAKTKTATHKI